MRLNIGCGGVVADGWVNADRAHDGPGITVRPAGVVTADLRWRLPWDDGTFSCAVANHVLQYLGYLEVVPALEELRRVLKPGGTLRVTTPSVKAGFAAYLRGEEDWFPTPAGRETSIDGRFCAWLTDHGTSRTVFTAAWLGELCGRAGFVGMATAEPGWSPFGADGICELDSRGGESFILEARR